MSLFRDTILERFKEDLVGPLADDEVLSDRPSQRYSTGILYPKGSRIQPEEDQDGALAVNMEEDAASNALEPAASLHTALKPSVAGLSFAIAPKGAASVPTIRVEISCATYAVFYVDEEGNEVPEKPTARSDERWRRQPLRASLEVPLRAGESSILFDDHGIAGLELYLLCVPRQGLITVTAALCNRRARGDSSAFDEQQHFFQVRLRVEPGPNTVFAPRPSQRAATDDDSRVAALIYRNEMEHVVGHTCAAQAETGESGIPVALRTSWIPAVIVPRVSDSGDPLFEKLRADDQLHPLEASWLAHANAQDLVAALNLIVQTYREWIAREQGRIKDLPEAPAIRAQAVTHIERCTNGANRMAAGIDAIERDESIRRAFQWSQEAMDMQFRWARSGEQLTWRPFQLAFQLLVLASLADGQHPDRETMDLLWFPTGGGKTEAYLGLAAFAILLRRLRAKNDAEGAGVTVLMRYTLRLLTIQQFQRAAAMICACEVIRRRSEADGSLQKFGTAPIGIGLWVGGAATPLRLDESAKKNPGDPSPQQLLDCPACGERLHWDIKRQGCSVTCRSAAGDCEIAAIGGVIPVWTIDEEVYRHAPSLVIGTIDKFAQIVRKQETGVLFGRGTHHPPPELIIQDELHLISGPLGSIAGLYEVAIDELCRHGGIRPKIVGSTATIRRASDQIRKLFDRKTYQFPSPGLDAGNSGFAVTDRESPGRLYVGLTTAGRSAYYMLQALVASLLQAAQAPGSTERERDHYWTLVLYFNSLRELGRSLVLMQDDVPVSIGQISARRDEEPREVNAPAELTSRVKGSEIRDMLDRLKIDASDPDAVNLLLASNMISVGMDIPRLGLMVVNAMPKTLSEYIQATSRVGRGEVPGLVVTMYNSMRPRDRSRFETFETWHRSLYRDVEATSVTPFASRAQDKALHAVLVALARHLVPGMGESPRLDHARRAKVEEIAALIEQRVASVDEDERTKVAHKLKALIAEWASRPDLERYWDDYGKKISLLLSAEQFAATVHGDPDADGGGAKQALWPTPNSMREVEAATPFILRKFLKAEGEAGAD